MADETIDALAALVERLRREYPQAEPPTVVQAVLHARDGVAAMGLTDAAGAAELIAMISERELRLRLGLEEDVARLDPETHLGRHE